MTNGPEELKIFLGDVADVAVLEVVKMWDAFQVYHGETDTVRSVFRGWNGLELLAGLGSQKESISGKGNQRYSLSHPHIMKLFIRLICVG